MGVNEMSDLSSKWEVLGEELKQIIEYKVESISFDISIQIFNRMKELELTKKEFAEKLGVSKAYITQLLRGKNNITLETLVKASDALGLSVVISLQPSERTVTETVCLDVDRMATTTFQDFLVPQVHATEVRANATKTTFVRELKLAG